MNNLILLGPEIFLSLCALLILLGEAFFEKVHKAWYVLGLMSLFATLGYYVLFFIEGQLPGVASFGVLPLESTGTAIHYPLLFEMISLDSVAVFFKIAVLISVIFILWLSMDYHEYSGTPSGLYTSLLLLSTVGMMIMVSATDFLLAVIGLELLSITSFVLVGFTFIRRSSSEAAIKYFLVGSLSTAILLFGVSYYYGYFGTTNIAPLVSFNPLTQSLDLALSLIIVFIVSGLGFKLAMVPFHMWAPDTYEGAPTPITAFLSIAPKAAAIGFLVRILSHHVELDFTLVLAALAALTMTVGNVGALLQTNVKRLLAYSSIAQVGYILVALVAGGEYGVSAALIYTFVYLFMNTGVFAVLIAITNKTKNDDLSTFAGLSKKSFGLSLLTIVLLLSMTGIPPMAGFIGKFAIFAAVIKTHGLLWLAIVTILNSVISLYYYFRIAHQMFFAEAGSTDVEFKLTPALVSCLVVTVGVTVLVGLTPNHLLVWVRNLVGS